MDSRRDFLKQSTALALSAIPAAHALAADAPAAAPAKNPLPRWRGFNLTNFFQALSTREEGQGMVREDDLRWMRDWGFDFVRLPMDYWMWVDSDWRQTRKLNPADILKIGTATMEKVDRAVDLCRKYKLHISLNFHRAPGYCINNPEREPFSLWTNKDAEDAFVFHWDYFAKRYKGVPVSDLSLNLVNEAPGPREGYMSREDYRRVMARAADAIRQHNPQRVIIVDGLGVGNDVATELIPAKVAQSVHAYWPAQISHFRAGWVDRNSSFPQPTWPINNPDGTIKMGRAQLEKRFAQWGDLARGGIGVHCGEAGCFNRTPYAVFTAWITDVMEVLKSHQIGYALWNFRGSFGILDSGRQDIQYEDWQGHKLDKQLLAILQKF